MRPNELTMTDGQLDEQTRARLADFDALYGKHAAFLWRTVRSLGVSAADAEDITQEVFLTAFRKLHEYAGRSALRTWLCGIAIGVARNHVRKSRRREAAHAPPGPEPHDPTAARDELELVSRCLAELDESFRLVFVLAEVEQLSAPEIAEVLGINVNTVYSRLRIARERFEASLERHGGAGR
ncbi:MAG: RNA polymerase sigma factor [Myxococcota bacterium]